MFAVVCEDCDGNVKVQCNPPFENEVSASVWIAKCKMAFPEYRYKVAIIRNTIAPPLIRLVPDLEVVL